MFFTTYNINNIDSKALETSIEILSHKVLILTKNIEISDLIKIVGNGAILEDFKSQSYKIVDFSYAARYKNLCGLKLLLLDEKIINTCEVCTYKLACKLKGQQACYCANEFSTRDDLLKVDFHRIAEKLRHVGFKKVPKEAFSRTGSVYFYEEELNSASVLDNLRLIETIKPKCTNCANFRRAPFSQFCDCTTRFWRVQDCKGYIDTKEMLTLCKDCRSYQKHGWANQCPKLNSADVKKQHCEYKSHIHTKK